MELPPNSFKIRKSFNMITQSPQVSKATICVFYGKHGFCNNTHSLIHQDCKNYFKYQYCFQKLVNKCPYFHRQMCPNWKKTGKCPIPECEFLHKNCENFQNYRICKRTECPFFHCLGQEKNKNGVFVRNASNVRITQRFERAMNARTVTKKPQIRSENQIKEEEDELKQTPKRFACPAIGVNEHNNIRSNNNNIANFQTNNSNNVMNDRNSNNNIRHSFQNANVMSMENSNIRHLQNNAHSIKGYNHDNSEPPHVSPNRDSSLISLERMPSEPEFEEKNEDVLSEKESDSDSISISNEEEEKKSEASVEEEEEKKNNVVFSPIGERKSTVQNINLPRRVENPTSPNILNSILNNRNSRMENLSRRLDIIRNGSQEEEPIERHGNLTIITLNRTNSNNELEGTNNLFPNGTIGHTLDRINQFSQHLRNIRDTLQNQEGDLNFLNTRFRSLMQVQERLDFVRRQERIIGNLDSLIETFLLINVFSGGNNNIAVGLTLSEFEKLPIFLFGVDDHMKNKDSNYEDSSTRKMCAICLEDYKQNDLVNRLYCFHQYHEDCLREWTRKKINCPVCKKNIREDIEANSKK